MMGQAGQVKMETWCPEASGQGPGVREEGTSGPTLEPLPEPGPEYTS